MQKKIFLMVNEEPGKLNQFLIDQVDFIIGISKGIGKINF